MKRLHPTLPKGWHKAASQSRLCASRASSTSTGDLATDMYLAECATSKNPLRRLIIGPFGRTVLPSAASTATVVLLSGSAWALADYFGQKWEMEAAIGWAKEAEEQRAMQQRKAAKKGDSQASSSPPQPAPKIIINTINPYQIGFAGLNGALLMGLGGRYWYPFLDKTVRRAFPAGSKHSIAMIKVSAEFCLWYPFTLMSYWALMGSVVYGQPIGELLSDASGQLIPTIVTEAPIWLPAQYINFRCLPALLQVYYVCAVAFAENMFMNYMKAEAMSDEEFRQNTKSI